MNRCGSASLTGGALFAAEFEGQIARPQLCLFSIAAVSVRKVYGRIPPFSLLRPNK
jgi:hypothetical protein